MALRADASTLRVHQVATDVAVAVIRLAGAFGGPGAFARGDQIVRAALSVPSNIAEACGRGSVREFRQYLSIARGSAQELLTQLRIAGRAQPLHADAAARLGGKVVLILKMLNRLHNSPPPTA